MLPATAVVAPAEREAAPVNLEFFGHDQAPRVERQRPANRRKVLPAAPQSDATRAVEVRDVYIRQDREDERDRGPADVDARPSISELPR
jgi:hypothetical protein